jgi:hypothetical protein
MEGQISQTLALYSNSRSPLSEMTRVQTCFGVPDNCFTGVLGFDVWKQEMASSRLMTVMVVLIVAALTFNVEVGNIFQGKIELAG